MATKKVDHLGVSVYMSERGDAYGNPRCIVHFTAFLTKGEFMEMSVEDGYHLAHERAKKAGFRKYTAKEFGGGFICEYDYCGGLEIAERVVLARG